MGTRKRSMLFLTVDAIIGNQAFQNGQGRNWLQFLDGVKRTHQMLNCSYSHWFACS